MNFIFQVVKEELATLRMNVMEVSVNVELIILGYHDKEMFLKSTINSVK